MRIQIIIRLETSFYSEFSGFQCLIFYKEFYVFFIISAFFTIPNNERPTFIIFFINYDFGIFRASESKTRKTGRTKIRFKLRPILVLD